MEYDQSKFFDNFRDETKQHLAFLNKGFLFVEEGEWNDDTMKQFMRVAHSIKGSARMMGYNSISRIAHSMEDMMGALKEQRLEPGGEVFDALFSGLDCISAIIERLSEGGGEDPALYESVLENLEAACKGNAAAGPVVLQKTTDASNEENHEGGEGRSFNHSGDGENIDISIFLDSFREEVKQNITDLNNGILAIEDGGLNDDLIENLMRIAHSVKGVSKMLGLVSISDIMHKIEDVFGGLKEKTIPIESDVFNVLFSSLDETGRLLAEAGDESARRKPSDAHHRLDALIETTNAAAPDEEALHEAHTSSPAEITKEAPKNINTAWAIPVPSAHGESRDSERPAGDENNGADFEQSAAKSRESDETIRIKTSRLDAIVNLVEEMILNQRGNEEYIRKFRSAYQTVKSLQERWAAMSPEIGDRENHKLNIEHMDRTLKNLVKEMGDIFKGGKNMAAHGALIMKGLQQDVMEMRMLPLSSIFDAYPRAARDLAHQFGKKIRFTIEGADTPLDKTIIEEISDPMVHLIRNAVDHGIETKEERLAAGKSETGSLALSASQHGDNVRIVLRDDGRGIDVEAIKKHAVQKGFIDETKINSYTDREILYFIAEPGFSTARKVTDVSGRGVGMDVVKRTVEAAKGRLSIETELGKGTTFTLIFPLSLAITRALLVKSAGEEFALPTGSVRETLRVFRDDIQQVVDKKAIRLRGSTIPVVKLSGLLRLKGRDRFTEYEAFPIIIIEAREQLLGIIVDEVLREQEIVLKSLGEHLRNARAVAGATILGNGDVVIALQPQQLMDIARDDNSFARREGLQIENTQGNAPAAKRKNILLANSSFKTREMEKIILESAGFSVDAVANGKEAREKALEKMYDLVITDGPMPEMDGIELARTLKASPLYKDVPVVILSSTESEEDRREGQEAGVDAYLVRSSFDNDYLVDTVRRFLL